MMMMMMTAVGCVYRQADCVKAEELQAEVSRAADAGQVCVDNLLESFTRCRETLQDHFSQLQYLLDLHDKVQQVKTAPALTLKPLVSECFFVG